MSGNTIRVMLVDDHPIVRAGYARLIEQAADIVVVAEAGSTAQAVQALKRLPPLHVVVTDLSMPGAASGFDLIGRISALMPTCHVLVLSMHECQALVRRAIEAGAAGFLSKRSAPKILVQSIRKVDAGQRVISPDLEPSSANPAMPADSACLDALSEREFALFLMLAQGYSIGECAIRLGISSKTASNNQFALREKLGVSTSAAMAHLALRWNLIKPDWC